MAERDFICFGLPESNFLGPSAKCKSFSKLGALCRKAIVSTLSPGNIVTDYKSASLFVCQGRLSNVSILGTCVVRIFIEHMPGKYLCTEA